MTSLNFYSLRTRHANVRYRGGGGGSLADIAASGGGVSRREPDPPKPISLPKVSILESDTELTNADYYAGKAAQAAAGLS